MKSLVTKDSLRELTLFLLILSGSYGIILGIQVAAEKQSIKESETASLDREVKEASFVECRSCESLEGAAFEEEGECC